MQDTTGPEAPIVGRTPRKAALASFMGSAVEYYDFFIFGSAAALIFPTVFFPSDDTSALVLSFATFGFAYVARPVGAVILGHFGDRIGRQKVLMFTLLLMGVSTFLIGCLPDLRRHRLGRPRAAGAVPGCCRASPRPASRPAPAR